MKNPSEMLDYKAFRGIFMCMSGNLVPVKAGKGIISIVIKGFEEF